MIFKVFAVILIPAVICVQAQECKTVSTVENFDIETYASAPWYSHQQAVNSYSPVEQNYCVTARYTVLDKPTFWGYTVGVNNRAKDESGASFGGDLCAYQTEESPSKLAVAPCFLPKFAAGPYWIVAYDEVEGESRTMVSRFRIRRRLSRSLRSSSFQGYALISGGQPTIVNKENGLCSTGTGINNSGKSSTLLCKCISFWFHG